MRSFIIQFIGFTSVVLGWIIAAIEFRHMYLGSHQFEITPWSFVLIFTTVGGLAIQTGEMSKSVDFIRSIRKPGGRRFYDKVTPKRKRDQNDQASN